MKNAFTLVELSIVLVILGLLVGGVLAGQNLIRAAELRSVVTEFNNYQTAVMTFKEKYFALPGDMTNATAFWGIAAGTNGSDNTCRNTVQTGTATCNGDGDGTNDSTGDELLTWKHLANAGLIEGNFSGTAASNGGFTSPYTNLAYIMPGWNVPESKSGGYWYAGNRGGWNASIQKFHGSFTGSAEAYYPDSLYLINGSDDPAAGGRGPLLPDEMWNLDKKIDDGRPGSGRVEAFRGGASATAAGACLTTGDPLIAEYDLDDDGACVPVFVRAFN